MFGPVCGLFIVGAQLHFFWATVGRFWLGLFDLSLGATCSLFGDVSVKRGACHEHVA